MPNDPSSVQQSGNSDAEQCTKNMHEHGSGIIGNKQHCGADAFIDGVEECFEQGNRQQLQ